MTRKRSTTLSIRHEVTNASRYIDKPFVKAPTCKMSTVPLIKGEWNPDDSFHVLNELNSNRHEKFGLVVYRCTYKDDAAWQTLKLALQENPQLEIDAGDHPELAEKLEWVFMDDRSQLDGATISALRPRFKQWAAEAIHAENPRATGRGLCTFDFLRYRYFVHVDEAVLQDLIQEGVPPQADRLGWPFVNLVDSEWEATDALLEHSDSDSGEEQDEVEQYEPIEGCTEENVGCMRAELPMVTSLGFYTEQEGDQLWWWSFYRRPYDVVGY